MLSRRSNCRYPSRHALINSIDSVFVFQTYATANLVEFHAEARYLELLYISRWIHWKSISSSLGPPKSLGKLGSLFSLARRKKKRRNRRLALSSRNGHHRHTDTHRHTRTQTHTRPARRRVRCDTEPPAGRTGLFYKQDVAPGGPPPVVGPWAPIDPFCFVFFSVFFSFLAPSSNHIPYP